VAVLAEVEPRERVRVCADGEQQHERVGAQVVAAEVEALQLAARSDMARG
jgi:hypothetical protein